MSLMRKMMRHGSTVVSKGVTTPRERKLAIKKGTPFRRYLKAGNGMTVHATKNRTTEA